MSSKELKFDSLNDQKKKAKKNVASKKCAVQLKPRSFLEDIYNLNDGADDEIEPRKSLSVAIAATSRLSGIHQHENVGMTLVDKTASLPSFDEQITQRGSCEKLPSDEPLMDRLKKKLKSFPLRSESEASLMHKRSSTVTTMTTIDMDDAASSVEQKPGTSRIDDSAKESVNRNDDDASAMRSDRSPDCRSQRVKRRTVRTEHHPKPPFSCIPIYTTILVVLLLVLVAGAVHTIIAMKSSTNVDEGLKQNVTTTTITTTTEA